MKSARAIVVGLVGGMLLAGIIGPAVIISLPPRLRGEPTVLIVGAAVVLASVYTSLRIQARNRR